MNISVEPGRYVVAVSGGVDSVVLLNVLSNIVGVEMVVAHFDHGIRAESHEDAEFVKRLAAQYGAPFYSERQELGLHASEALAREKRYKFLRRIVTSTGSRALITAHHKDDVIETAYINVVRGTGRNGLTSLRSTDDIVRPLLQCTKATIIEYANVNSLQWREDATNETDAYLRNRIRKKLIKHPDLSEQMYAIVQRMTPINQAIDQLMSELYGGYINKQFIDRAIIIAAPYTVGCEIMRTWLKSQGSSYDRTSVHRLVVAARTARAGTQHDIDAGHVMKCEQKQIRITARSSV